MAPLSRVPCTVPRLSVRGAAACLVLAACVGCGDEALVRQDGAWEVEGAFARGGAYRDVDESALARTPAAGGPDAQWGSYLGDDANLGVLRSPVFEAPRLMALFSAGDHAASGNELFLRRERDGARLLLQLPQSGETWREGRIWLPGDWQGEPVRLVARDDASGYRGWLGIGTPRSIGPGSWLLYYTLDLLPVPIGWLAAGAATLALASLLARTGRGAHVAAAWAQRARAWGPYAISGLLVLVYCVHLGVVYRYGVDVPAMDEWGALYPGALARELNWHWLLAQHNEHIIIPTKLQTWILYRFDAWNLRVNLVLNFLIFGVLVAAVVAFGRRYAPHLGLAALLAASIFLLSPTAHENHSWGFQSQFHFALLALLACAAGLFDLQQRWLWIVAGTLAALLSMICFSLAVPASCAIAGVFVLWKLTRLADTVGPTRMRELLQLLLPLAAIAAGGAFWVAAHSAALGHPPRVSPLELDFWRHYLNIVSLGFGVTSHSYLLGALWLGAVGQAFAIDLWRSRGQLPAGRAAVLALSAGVLVGLATVSFGRAGFGPEQAKASRYAEIGALLVPLTAMAWSGALLRRPRLRRRVLALFLGFCLLASLDDWNTREYRRTSHTRRAGLACLLEAYRSGVGKLCVEIYPRSMPERLVRARELDLSFYRKLRPRLEAAPGPDG